MPTLKDETLPEVASLAPTLIAAGIEEAKLQEDNRPYEADPKGPELPAVPAHHVQAAYDAIQRGEKPQDAARVAGVPVEVAEAVLAEVEAVKDALKGATPIKRGKAEEDPIGQDIGGGDVVIDDGKKKASK